MAARKSTFVWLIIHIALLAPLVFLLSDLNHAQLTANPFEAAIRRTGKTALILLVLTLACTPTYNLSRFRPLLPLRRVLGLYVFFYASIHLFIFAGLDYQFNFEFLQEAMLEKRYALAGLSAFLLLLPMAISSTSAWRTRLGTAWKWLHRAIYVAAPLVVVHYLWGVKLDTRAPLQFAAIVLILLLLRLPFITRAMPGRRRPTQGT